MKIKIMLADDHKIVRDGIRSLLETQNDFTIIAEASTGREAIHLAKDLSPNIVLMDIAMPDVNGIDASMQILKDNANIKIIILSMHEEKMFIAKAFKAGVSGYLLKDCNIEEIIQAIHDVYSGKKYISNSITNTVIEDYRDIMISSEYENRPLSNREREVLQLIAEGNTSKEIATKLSISIKTVENHRQQIMDKLNIRSIAGLTRYAIREGIIV